MSLIWGDPKKINKIEPSRRVQRRSMCFDPQKRVQLNGPKNSNWKYGHQSHVQSRSARSIEPKKYIYRGSHHHPPPPFPQSQT